MLDKAMHLHDDETIHIPTRVEKQDFYPKLKTFWSCSHMNCFLHYMLHINLHILYLFCQDESTFERIT